MNANSRVFISSKSGDQSMGIDLMFKPTEAMKIMQFALNLFVEANDEIATGKVNVYTTLDPEKELSKGLAHLKGKK